MVPVQKRAQACYHQHAVAGTIAIKVVVAPSDNVTRAQATDASPVPAWQPPL